MQNYLFSLEKGAVRINRVNLAGVRIIRNGKFSRLPGKKKEKENANLVLRGEFKFNNSVYCSTVGKRDITGQHFSSMWTRSCSSISSTLMFHISIIII